MRRRTARFAVVAGIAGVVSACATLDQLNQYSSCDDCDAGSKDSGGDGASDTSTPAGDGGAGGSDAAPANDDAGDGGDAGSSLLDAGPGLDATDASDATTASDATGGTDANGMTDATGDADAASGAVTYASDGAAGTCALSVDASLLVYYPFDDNTNDESGNGNDGVARAGTDITYVTPGKLGVGVTIDTGGTGIAVTGETVLSGAKTLCAWINPTPGTTGQSLPVFTAALSGGQNFYDIEAASMPTAGSCTVAANSLFIDDGTCATTTVTTVTPGMWNFVCYAYGVGSTTFYANATSQTVVNNQNDPFLLSGISIGSNEVGGSTTRSLFVGQMDEVSIWSGWLPSTAIGAIYNGGSGCRLR